MSSGAGNPVLKALDKAQTQAYHFKAIVIAGMGFFTDAYDLFVIGLLTKLLGRIYYYNPDKPTTVGQLPPNVYSAVTAVALCGTLAGQLFFGWAGDKFGRKKVYGITLALMVVASLAQGLSFGHTSTSVIVTLCFFRFWLGFGIGGDYPLSATIMSEYSNSRTRGAFVACVFAMQGIGYLFAAAVCIIVVSGFNNYYPAPTFQASPVNSTPLVADWVWRIVLMFGAVPAALTFYSRSKMPETARYTALVESDQRQAALDMEKVLNTHFESTEEEQQEVKMQKKQRRAGQYGLFTRQFVRRHGTELMACSVTWFLLDASYYSQNLFQSQIFSASGWIPPTSHMSALEETFKNARAQAYIALCGTVPGYWFTVAFVDIWGRRPIQIMGFAMMSVFMYILAFDFYGLRGHYHSANGTITGGNHAAFIVLYAFTFFFSNFGPNTTTFIIPAELFPARLRSTCSGIAAATGKAGSIVGTFGFLYASQDSHASRVTPGYPPGIGYKYSFLILAICATVGCVVSILFTPETKGRSLEDLSGEDEENNAIADGGGDMEEGDGDKV